MYAKAGGLEIAEERATATPFSETRSAHSLMVARRMVELCEEEEFTSINPQEAYLLGLLHDIGYTLNNDRSTHAWEGGKFLRDLGYKHWHEVKAHGKPDSRYSSVLLDLLNIVNLTVSSDGRVVDVQGRFDDLLGKYSLTSVQVMKEAMLIDELTRKGYGRFLTDDE